LTVAVRKWSNNPGSYDFFVGAHSLSGIVLEGADGKKTRLVKEAP